MTRSDLEKAMVGKTISHASAQTLEQPGHDEICSMELMFDDGTKMTSGIGNTQVSPIDSGYGFLAMKIA